MISGKFSIKIPLEHIIKINNSPSTDYSNNNQTSSILNDKLQICMISHFFLENVFFFLKRLISKLIGDLKAGWSTQKVDISGN